jgi:hypothetical protein
LIVDRAVPPAREAASYMTGQEIAVEGGLTKL